MPFSDGIADFRSDTVTRPTSAMLHAMATAPLGDDVYHDDPTVNLLEEEAAAAVGHDAAVLTPSGTMGNQLCVMLHTSPGEEVLAPEDSHLRSLEGGAPQALSGVGFRTVPAAGGRVEVDHVEQAMTHAGRVYPRISLMCWENTHNRSGGKIIPIEMMEQTSAVARRHGLAIHVDGARIFNAVAATGVPAPRYAGVADTIQFCFSKGLGAPVGSIVCGGADHMEEIRYLRRRLGGGMRQAGVIAAAARVALSERERLVEDHVLAAKLGAALAERFPGSVDTEAVETNMVLVDFPALSMTWEEANSRLEAAGVKANPPSSVGNAWRLVTHRDLDATDVERLVGALA